MTREAPVSVVALTLLSRRDAPPDSIWGSSLVVSALSVYSTNVLTTDRDCQGAACVGGLFFVRARPAEAGACRPGGSSRAGPGLGKEVRSLEWLGRWFRAGDVRAFHARHPINGVG
jgi:hypothetical protein